MLWSKTKTEKGSLDFWKFGLRHFITSFNSVQQIKLTYRIFDKLFVDVVAATLVMTENEFIIVC